MHQATAHRTVWGRGSFCYIAGAISSATDPMRYCGEYQDYESGLIYLRARYYNPQLGRFINEDPIKDGLNWYVYCNNNPVNRVDPTGKNPQMRAQNVTEGVYGSLMVGIFPTIVGGIFLAGTARDLGSKYAKEHGYYANGDLITWENEADAYRHFVWNVMMTKEIDSFNAYAISMNHEMATWKSYANPIGTLYEVKLASLMDINNNLKGIDYALKYPDLSYDESFDKAINEGALLTSLDSVRQKYGFTDKMLFTGIDANGEEYQYVYICFSNNACTIIARSGEVIEL